MYRLTREQIRAAGPCDEKIIDALWEGSPHKVSDEVLEFPDAIDEKEATRLLKRDPRAIFWLVARGLIPLSFEDCCRAWYPLREERRAEKQKARVKLEKRGKAQKPAG